MTADEIATTMNALRASLEARGLEISHTAVQRWSFYSSEPYWDVVIEERFPGTTKLRCTAPTVESAFEMLATKVADWIPDEQRLADILGIELKQAAE